MTLTGGFGLVTVKSSELGVEEFGPIADQLNKTCQSSP